MPHPFSGSPSRAGLLLALAAVASIFLASVQRASAVDFTDPYLDSITSGGSGCPQSSVGSSFASDRGSFTLIFDSFVASSGNGVPVTENRKNCQLNLNLNASGPMTTLVRLDFRGYAQLPAGVTSETKSVAYSSDNVIASSSLDHVGPASKNYLFRQDICVRLSQAGISAVNVNAQARVLGSLQLSSQLTIDSIDGKILDVPCVPQVGVQLSGVTDGATYLYSQQPRPTCLTNHFGEAGADAVLSLEGSAPGTITATCSGGTDGNGGDLTTVSATYDVICSLADTYEGTVTSKLNAQSQGTRKVLVTLAFSDTNCDLLSVQIAADGPPLPGSVTVDTAADWKAPTKTSVLGWSIKKSVQSLSSGSIIIGGQPRAMDTSTVLQVKLINGTNGLTLALSGKAPNGVGSTKTSFELNSTGAGLTALQDQ